MKEAWASNPADAAAAVEEQTEEGVHYKVITWRARGNLPSSLTMKEGDNWGHY